MSAHQRCGTVAVMGLPNAGKSTLLNALIQASVAAVSPKAQTTRFQVRGIVTDGDAQIIIIDTPGLLKRASDRLERAMLRASQSAPLEADIILAMIDVTRGKKQLDAVLAHIVEDNPPPLWVVLNKIDKVPRESLLEWAALYADRAAEIFMISATREDGTADILKALADAMPERPWLFDQETLTTLSTRLWAAEVTREVLLHALGQEVPHKLYVETETVDDAAGGALRIGQVIHVADKAHKKIVLGQGGAMIKKISTTAREKMTERLQRKIHLFLYVRHTADWAEKSDFYRMTGLPLS
jgi:GTP-binding protein Era